VAHLVAHKKASRWRILPGLVAVLCVVPAAAINVEFGLHEGRSAAHISGMIGLVLGAAMAGVALERATAWRQRLPALLCLLVFTSCNIMNALGLVESHRAAGQSGAKTEIGKRASLVAEKNRLGGALVAQQVALSGRAESLLVADIAARKTEDTWRRSKSCEDVTLPASRLWCAEHFKLDAELASVRKVAELQRDLGAVERELRTIPEGVVVDAQAEGLAALLGMTVEAAGRLVDALTAIGIELLAALGPALVMVASGRAHAPVPRPVASASQPAFVPAPASEEPAGVDALAAFIVSVQPSNRWLANTEMRQAYVATCRENGEHPRSQQAFSKALTAARFEHRRINGRVEWRLPAPRLAVVANGLT
jgi:hypothetical protein